MNITFKILILQHESAIEALMKICQTHKDETKDMRLKVFKSKNVQGRTGRARQMRQTSNNNKRIGMRIYNHMCMFQCIK